MAVTHRSTPSASPPSLAAVAEIPSRPLIDEVLEEEIKTEEDIASAQAGISLAMSIEDIFRFSVEFPIPDVPDIQGEPTPIP